MPFAMGGRRPPKGKGLLGGVFQLRKPLFCRRYSSIKTVAVNVLAICDHRNFSPSSQGVTNSNGSSSREHCPALCARTGHAL